MNPVDRVVAARVGVPESEWAGLPALVKQDHREAVFDHAAPLPKQPTYRPREWEQETTQ